jgi:hypothetical protein
MNLDNNKTTKTWAVTILNGTVKKVEADYYDIDDNGFVHFYLNGSNLKDQTVAGGYWVFVEQYDPEVHVEKFSQEDKNNKPDTVLELFNKDN